MSRNLATRSTRRRLWTPGVLRSLDLWLRADDVPGADGTAIQTWIDKSSAGHDCTQGTVGNRPLIKDNIINGHRAMRFDGTDDNMQSVITAGTAKTIFLVVQKRGAVSATGQIAASLGVANTRLLMTDTDLATAYLLLANQAAGVVDLGGVPTNANIVAFRLVSASSMTGYIGGGAGTSFDPHDSYTTQGLLVLGARDNLPVSPGDFDIAEVIVITDALPFRELNLVGSYLARRYALPWAAAS